MEAEEPTHARLEPCQRLEMSLFSLGHKAEEAPHTHFYVSLDVLIEDNLPAPDTERFCDSNCACT
jgi:hypothetical protein